MSTQVERPVTREKTRRFVGTLDPGQGASPIEKVAGRTPGPAPFAAEGGDPDAASRLVDPVTRVGELALQLTADGWFVLAVAPETPRSLGHPRRSRAARPNK